MAGGCWVISPNCVRIRRNQCLCYRLLRVRFADPHILSINKNGVKNAFSFSGKCCTITTREFPSATSSDPMAGGCHLRSGSGELGERSPASVYPPREGVFRG